MEDCPICEVEFQNDKGVIGHISGSTDDDHKGYGFQQAQALLADSASAESHGSTESHGSAGNHSSENHGSGNHGSVLYERSDAPKSDSAQSSEQSSCCSSPNHVGSAGEMYRLDSGEVVQLDDGDRICANCDEVLEA